MPNTSRLWAIISEDPGGGIVTIISDGIPLPIVTGDKEQFDKILRSIKRKLPAGTFSIVSYTAISRDPIKRE